jgi:hypothetical protein
MPPSPSLLTAGLVIITAAGIGVICSTVIGILVPGCPARDGEKKWRDFNDEVS